MRERSREHGVNVVASKRLGEMIERTEFHRLDCVCGVGESSEDHNRRGRAIRMRFQIAQQVQAVHPAQAQIEENECGGDGFETRQRFFARRRDDRFVSEVANCLSKA